MNFLPKSQKIDEKCFLSLGCRAVELDLEKRSVLRGLCWSTPSPSVNAEVQLSHAPPELDIEMASCTDEPKEPVNKPKTAWTPKKVPAAKGDKITWAKQT